MPLRGSGKDFWSFVEPEPMSGCWLWVGARSHGYGVYATARRLGHRNYPAHRLAFELLRGPITKDLQLDHLCRVRACVNPSHLEPVDCRTNLLRGVGWTARHAKQSACPRGHPYDVLDKVNGQPRRRACRCCRNERHRRAARQRRWRKWLSSFRDRA